jgi:hypothetical protein
MQRIRVAKSGRKHRVVKHRIVAAMRHCGVPVIRDDESMIYEGRDTSGRLLEVGAYEADNGDLIVFHVLPKEWVR